MKNQQINIKPGVRVFISLFIGVLLLLSVSNMLMAQAGVDGAFFQRGDKLVGQFDFVIDGAGLANVPTPTVTMTVPGDSVEVAYLYWSGLRNGTAAGSVDDPQVALTVDGVTTTVNAISTYGPSSWAYGFGYHNTYVADVTNLVKLGGIVIRFLDMMLPLK